MPVWGGNRGRQNCDGSRAHNADRLLIRPASGRQAGTGLPDRTHHWKDTRERSHSRIESRTKSTDTNLTNAPDGTTAHSQMLECSLGPFSAVLLQVAREKREGDVVDATLVDLGV